MTTETAERPPNVVVGPAGRALRDELASCALYARRLGVPIAPALEGLPAIRQFAEWADAQTDTRRTDPKTNAVHAWSHAVRLRLYRAHLATTETPR